MMSDEGKEDRAQSSWRRLQYNAELCGGTMPEYKMSQCRGVCLNF